MSETAKNDTETGGQVHPIVMPWTPPFKFEVTSVFDSKGHRVCDMRGWGFLTGKGGGLGLDKDTAASIQDQMGEHIAALLNAGDWLGSVGDEIHANKLRHGWKVTTSEDWENQHEIPAVLALIHSEVSEALEAFRKNDRPNFEEELADIGIRLIGLSHGMGIDLKAAIVAKVEKNKTREHRHGGKRV